ncbi:MAG: LysR family transcriptional regulator [Roseibium sp.]|nr:LysR family transcriptional regulator [Roseibium sp.]
MNDINWNELQLFYHVARLGSLSAVARLTGLSAPTIGRRMLALERSTGRSLFVRRQTGYTLAKDGQILFERVSGMQFAAQSIAEWQDNARRLPMVVLSAGTFTSRFIAGNLSSIWTPADPFRLCFKTAESRVEFAHREADVAVRNERPTSGNVAVRRAGEVAFAPYCAVGLDLEQNCNWVALDSEASPTPSARWISGQPGITITAWTNTPSTLYHLACGGAGRAVLPCFIGDRDRFLERAGPVINELTHTAWIVMHDDERHRPEVRTVIDRLAALIDANSALFAGRTRPGPRRN